MSKSGESTREEAFDLDGHLVSVREQRADGSQWNIQYRYDAGGHTRPKSANSPIVSARMESTP